MKLLMAKVNSSLYLVDGSSTDKELKKAMPFKDIPSYLKKRALGELRDIKVDNASFAQLSDIEKITLAHEENLFKHAAKRAQTMIICQEYDRLRCPK